MKILSTVIFFFVRLLALGDVQADTVDARLDIVEPFGGYTLTWESPELYIRIVNTGSVPITVGEDVVFEIEGQDIVSNANVASNTTGPVYFHGRGDPFKQVPPQKGGDGVIVPPGHAFAMNSHDYDLGYTVSEPQKPVRFHYRIVEGRWITSEWILPKRDLSPIFEGGKLFAFQLTKGADQLSVTKAKVNGEPWLLACNATGTYLLRLCYLPPGVKPISLTHNMETRILTIHFDSGEEDVVFDTLNGVPLSGSKRTLPHLYWWKGFAGRPFTRDSRMKDFVKSESHALTIKLSPEEFAKYTNARELVPPALAPDQVSSLDSGEKFGGTSESGSFYSSRRVWIVGGTLIVLSVIVIWWCLRRKIA